MSAVGADTVARLRPLAARDVPVLTGLERTLFGAGAWSAAMLGEELSGPGRWYVGAVVGDEPGPADVGTGPPEGTGAPDAGASLVGYAGLWFDGHDAQVMTIGVATEHQGRRIGRLLLDALVERARVLGAGSVLLEVRVDNAPALALYRRAGFVVMGRRRGYYQPEGVDAFTMRLDLGNAPTLDVTAPGSSAPGSSAPGAPGPGAAGAGA